MKIAIVEDEMIIADHIRTLLEGQGYDITEPCVTYGQAIEMIETEHPDLILLDIQLAGKKDGIDIAHKIDMDYHIPYIFITSFSNKTTLDRVKEVSPMAYLVKPFKKEDLYTSLELAFHNANRKLEEAPISAPKKEDSFFIKSNGLYHKIKFNDVLFIKSDHVYVELYLSDGKKIVHRGTLNEIENYFPASYLFKVHRSYLINKDAVDAINSICIQINDLEIPIGKKYRDSVMAEFDLR